MNEFLANHYGTGGDQVNEDEAALEKMAQLTLLVKEAEEEGIDLSELTEDEAFELAGELYGEDAEDDDSDGGDEEDFEKEAAAKVEEADFLGRVMAHSMWQELDSIQKEAGFKEKATEMGSKAWQAIKSAPGKAKALPGELGGKAEAATAKNLREGGKGRIMKALIHRLGGAKGGAPRSGNTYRAGSKRLAELAGKATTVGAKAAPIAGGVAAAGGGTALALRGRGQPEQKGKKKKASAFEKLAEERALQMLFDAGYIDEAGNVYAPEGEGQEKTAGEMDFETTLEVAALQMLEENGWPVQWNGGNE